MFCEVITILIARIFVWLILLIVLPDLYLDWQYLRRHPRFTLKKRVLWWLPCIVMLVYTVALASIKNFVPTDLRWLSAYLSLVGVIVMPKAVFAFCSAIGLWWARRHHLRVNRGNMVGAVGAVITVILFIYSITLGPRQFTVRHVDLTFKDLPKAFDGYRIVQFSDAHIGSFNHVMDHCLERNIDSVIAARPDMICFTGDLQNLQPGELQLHAKDLRRLATFSKGRVPVISVLGNHDYSYYVGGSEAHQREVERQMVEMQKSLGWRLLRNENMPVVRGRDTLWIAGEEWGEIPKAKRCPNRSDLRKTLRGIPKKAFTIVLQHNPKMWDLHILPESKAQLTLAGHTHAGQIELFGLRPTMLSYKEDYGLYENSGRYLYVSCGWSGAFPCRLGATPEIVVITLHRGDSAQ